MEEQECNSATAGCNNSPTEQYAALGEKTLRVVYVIIYSVRYTGLGIGYRNNRLEVGSTISSAAIHVGTACLPLGHPIIGLIGGAMAFGGLDAYVRYDLLPSPKYNLSAGIGGNVTYCMLGASDVSATVGLSLHASFTTKGGTTFFAESNVPVFGYEYSSSCAPTLPQPDGNPAETTQTVTESAESG